MVIFSVMKGLVSLSASYESGKKVYVICLYFVRHLAYHLGVTAVRIMANAANCNEDLSKSEVVKQVCQAVGVESPSHLPSILVSESPELL